MDFSVVRKAEEELLTSATRRKAARVLKLLHPEFLEIGRSGRTWTRSEIIAMIESEEGGDETATDEWRFSVLADNTVLVTYRILGRGAQSRHSSVWQFIDGELQLRFHQGTFIAAG